MATTEQGAWVTLLKQRGLGAYKITDLIGGGGFGLVFEAIDTRSNVQVAIKVLQPGAGGDATIEFEDEGKILRKLTRASNVVSLIESSETPIVLDPTTQLTYPFKYHVMELASGCLEELVVDDATRNSLSWVAKLALWRGAIKGIHQMHINGCVHRDIKSSNCLLFIGQKNSYDCKITDLGRSRDLSEIPRLAPHEYLLARGDRRFAAPELLHLQGGYDDKSFKLSDLYGLGSLLYELGTGQGITSVALGYGPHIVMQSIDDYHKGHRIDLSSLRAKYGTALALFEAEVPLPIRRRATTLVRQLCDPVPSMRLPRTGPGVRRWIGPGLEWLLNQADIMTRTLAIPGQRRAGIRVGRGV